MIAYIILSIVFLLASIFCWRAKAKLARKQRRDYSYKLHKRQNKYNILAFVFAAATLVMYVLLLMKFENH
jgi:formate hydrogenlyase subunit 3/multisubunit Na+/H+ antiporter MnhD subunit